MRAPAVLAMLFAAAPALAQQPAPEAKPGWFADAATKCRVWIATPMPATTISYVGGCANTLAEGDGILRILVGGRPFERYIGDFRAGRKDGKGTYTWQNRDRYEGEWKNDLQNGKGVMVYDGGGRYTGQWKDGRAHGPGSYKSREFAYDGNWTNGCFRDGERRATVGSSFAECGFR